MPITTTIKRTANILVSLSWVMVCVNVFAATTNSPTPTSLENGYKLLYDLRFDSAHGVFAAWTREHPDDPLGPVSDAAGYLFSELNRLGILEGQFYESDKQFDGRKKVTPDPVVRDQFAAVLDEAETRAKARLAKNAKDRDSLFAMTMASGLKADYAALIEKSNLASLHFTRDSAHWSEQLLAVDPDCYDAHLAGGFAKYIVGSMSAPMRWLLRMGGIAGDKEQGITELKLTADHGEYLAPFARILLAIAYVREKETSRALSILAALEADFPNNPLFAKEIARLDASR